MRTLYRVEFSRLSLGLIVLLLSACTDTVFRGTVVTNVVSPQVATTGAGLTV